MNLKFLHLIIAFIFSISCAIAQETVCGVEHRELNETQIHKIQEIENFTQQYISEYHNQVQQREIITIPVVVHIVWKEEEENIPDIEIQAQIDGLTADFRKMNENQSIIPAVFQPLVADVEIEFCLASVDPLGKQTDGIIRKQTTVDNIGSALAFGDKPKICYDNLGGSGGWDPSSYINIWVGKMESINLGRATMPGEADIFEDGIFINSDFFGFFCSTSSGYFHGRTLTHEMGHFFNLHHIFAEPGECSSDLVDDTPTQSTAYRGCPSFPQNSCGSSDMFMNFMDYVDDNCMAMFTHGQKMRMQAALAEPTRAGLKNSKGCDWIPTQNRSLTPDDILLFPNPAAECVHIDLDLDNDEPITMSIFNTAGQAVYSNMVFVKDLRTFDTSNFSNGVYFIYFEANSQVASKKLIINK